MMCNDLWNCTQNKQRYYKFLKLICTFMQLNKKKDALRMHSMYL